MATVIIWIISTVWHLQDLGAVFYPFLHPGIQDVFDWSETGTVIEGGEEAHADGAGQSGWSGDPAASFIKRLYGGENSLYKRKDAFWV